jgi:UDP-glucose 4-epimerase
MVSRVLTIFIKRVIQNKPPVIFGKGDQYRDFIYVDDVVKIHNLCLIDKRADGKIYNVGSGEKTTIRELAKLVIRVSGKDLKPITEQVKEGEFSKIVKDKKRNPSELKGMCLGIKKAKIELGWKPRISLVEGIEREIKWAEKNLFRWKKVHYTL